MGFEARKFFHFLERLGFPYPKGEKLPPEARKLSNWKGREIVGTILAAVPYTKTVVDQTTGEEKEEVKPGSCKVLLFSYRPADSTKATYSRAGELAAQPQRRTPSQAEQAAADDHDYGRAAALRDKADKAALLAARARAGSAARDHDPAGTR